MLCGKKGAGGCLKAAEGIYGFWLPLLFSCSICVPFVRTGFMLPYFWGKIEWLSVFPAASPVNRKGKKENGRNQF